MTKTGTGWRVPCRSSLAARSRRERAGFHDSQRVATPDDQAQVVAWLLVGECGWVNGIDLPVDNGLSAGMTVGWANPKDSPASRSRNS